MRLVLISDTHSHHRKINVPDGDVLIHAGDFTFGGEEDVVKDFNTWLGELPHRHKLVIAGNHELYWTEQKRKLLTNCIYLQDSGHEIDGIKFWGSPFTPKFGPWAFMLPRGQSMYEKWLTIPHDTDVLITHGPPHGMCDTALPGGESLGCRDLRCVVDGIQPLLHVFGHIHGGYGYVSRNQTDTDDERTTVFVNAAACNEAYQPVNKPITGSIYIN